MQIPYLSFIQMGAGLIKIFDQCPLVIHCASTWIHPETKDQLILFGSDLGIYCLNLKMYLNGDSTLELVSIISKTIIILEKSYQNNLFILFQVIRKKNNMVVRY
jgi:hypothetical protein